MSCNICGQSPHNWRCPYYEEVTTRKCDICDNGVFEGDEYIENDLGEIAHLDCFESPRDLADWLGYDIEIFENEEN